MQWILGPLGQVNHLISIWARNLAGLLLVGMLAMILAQVIFRYVLNNSLGWTEELSKFAMVWITCLVSPWVYRQGLNVSIQMFADALPPVIRRLTELTISLLILLISYIFLLESVEFWRSGWHINASSMPVKLAWFYACAPFAFASILLVAIEKALQQLLELFAGSAGHSQEVR